MPARHFSAFVLLAVLGCAPQAPTPVPPRLPQTELYRVGYRDFPGPPFTGRVWYPISPIAPTSNIPTGRIFQVLGGARDHEPVREPAAFPLLLVSHGSGAMVARLDWLAHYFVARGWIVAGINHPGNTVDDNTADGLMRVWDRARQASTFLGAFLAADPLGARVDRGRIAAAGYSAGGAAVLMLAGARLSADRLQSPVPRCLPRPKDLDDERCADLKRLDPRRYPRAAVEADYRDARVRAVVALDPGFARSFVRPQALAAPALALIAARPRRPEGEIFVRELPAVFPGAEVRTVPGAIHVSFVSPCNDVGFAARAPVCLGDTNRPAIQREVAREAFDFLSASLASGTP